MEVIEAIQQRRSIRRFSRCPVERELLEEMAEAARLSPTGMNLQPLCFAVVSKLALCDAIFPHTRWARLIPDGSAGPDWETRPSAYIAILVDKTIVQSADTDAGAAGMSILLAAQAREVVSCWLGSIDRDEILALLGLEKSRYALHTLVALGYPAMQSRIVPMEGEDTAYFLEGKNSLCVPKRPAQRAVRWFE